MKNIILIIISLFVFIGCSTLKVSVDYDPGFNFESKNKFAIVHHNKEGEDTLLNDRIISALEPQLESRSYVKVAKEEADLIFVFHTNAESKVDIDTDYRMVGYGGYRYGGQMIATTRAYQYTKGTLIIDALNPKDKKVVWRGIATDTLKEYDSPQEREQYINEVIQELIMDFPSQ